MSASVTDNPAAGRYEIHDDDGALAGFVAYHSRPGLMAMVHTEIDPRFEGRGFGSELARGALEDARSRGLLVLPFCPFINGYIRKHPEYLDLVPDQYREHFQL